jgi:hypothetical protein
MSLASIIGHPDADRCSAIELLGADHPLTRALDDLVTAVRQLVVVLVLGCAAFTATIAGMAWGLPLAVGAAAVAVGLACRAALVSRRRTECVLAMVLRGADDLALAPVNKMRTRLLDERHRRRLATALDRVRQANQPPVPGHGAARPLADPRVIAAVEPELAHVVALLITGQPSVRGVAKARQLLEGPASPLFGNDAHVLREALNQVAFMLQADEYGDSLIRVQ